MSDLQGFEGHPARISTRPAAVGRFEKPRLRADSEIRALIPSKRIFTIATRYGVVKGDRRVASRPARLAGTGQIPDLQGFNGGVAA